MYDMTKLKTRYFNMKLKNGKIIDIEPPRLKILRKIATLSKTKVNEELTESDVKNLIEATALALNKNRQEYRITAETIEEYYNIEDVMDFLNNYFDWINETQNLKN